MVMQLSASMLKRLYRIFKVSAVHMRLSEEKIHICLLEMSAVAFAVG